jgi:hypothetical protein
MALSEEDEQQHRDSMAHKVGEGDFWTLRLVVDAIYILFDEGKLDEYDAASKTTIACESFLGTPG